MSTATTTSKSRILTTIFDFFNKRGRAETNLPRQRVPRPHPVGILAVRHKVQQCLIQLESSPYATKSSNVPATSRRSPAHSGSRSYKTLSLLSSSPTTGVVGSDAPARNGEPKTFVTPSSTPEDPTCTKLAGTRPSLNPRLARIQSLSTRSTISTTSPARQVSSLSYSAKKSWATTPVSVLSGTFEYRVEEEGKTDEEGVGSVSVSRVGRLGLTGRLRLTGVVVFALFGPSTNRITWALSRPVWPFSNRQLQRRKWEQSWSLANNFNRSKFEDRYECVCEKRSEVGTGHYRQVV